MDTNRENTYKKEIKMINYIRSLFCCHEFELIKNANVYENQWDKYPIYTKRIYMCKKCGHVKRVKC